MKVKKKNLSVASGAAPGGTREKIERLLVFFAFLLGGLIVVLVISLFMDSKPEKDEYVVNLEKRVALLEGRISGFSPGMGKSDGRGEFAESLENIMIRCERLEGALSLKTEVINRRVETLGVEIEGLKSRYENRAGTQAIKPNQRSPLKKEKSPIKEPPKKEALYHYVKKGETFYSISRKYGISLEKLQKLNGLTGKSLLYPRQKLRIE